MNGLIALLGLLAAALLQVRLPMVDMLGQAKVPLFLGIVLYYALRRDVVMMIVIAVVAGFLQDATSRIPLGYSSVCLIAVGWVTWRVREQLVTDAVVTQVVLGGLSALLLSLVMYALLLQADLVAVRFSRAILRSIGTGLLGAAAVPLVCQILDRADRAVGNIQTASEVETEHGEVHG